MLYTSASSVIAVPNRKRLKLGEDKEMQTVQTLAPTVMVKNLILLLVFHIAALPFSSADSVQVQMFPPIRFLHFVIFDGSNVFPMRIFTHLFMKA